jgi:hypothetical protein
MSHRPVMGNKKVGACLLVQGFLEFGNLNATVSPRRACAEPCFEGEDIGSNSARVLDVHVRRCADWINILLGGTIN